MTFEQLARQGRRVDAATMELMMYDKLRQIRKASIKAAFAGSEVLRHRNEYVDTVNKIDYYDDASATTSLATWFTFENLNKKVVWIAGDGTDDSDYVELMPMVNKYVKALVCVGKNTPALHEAFGNVLKGRIFDADDLDAAVISATHLATAGDTVLFSPSCDIDDRYETSAERGERFKADVNRMK